MGIKDVIDCFAKCYGARFSLDRESDEVDEDAALILENLHTSGHKNVERLLCFDLSTTRLILKDIANFHATTIALKLKKPEVFQKRLKAFCSDFVPTKEVFQPLLAILKEVLEENEKCKPLASKIRYWGEREHEREPREPFATLAHCDLWVNNMMQKFVDGVPISNKLVDFQIYNYRSAASDVFFFLFSSVQLEVLERCLDSLLKFYHEHFISVLDMLKCDTSEFGFDAFLEEMKLEAEFEFGHALFFSTIVVQGKKRTSDLTEHSFHPEQMRKYINDTARRRAWYMTLECDRRGWLY
ncbi:unnamed protein product [Acanthoscelides obtectus]|uniref:CHK kinase-like domain-containing protein n=1 Tax=Acanthoscelides obtectus TaxID=200917 RepID=A0A9P0L9L4_ACAOB|nr:unnamed protein product [Acanthoscelides obtectus]CAK1638524.1 hypothetical protein AOBTE_LOCUS10646 [Acanthoscelides obtectus]